jgi:hypothetical protein
MLAGLRQGDDPVDDDFGHRVINITVEQERVTILAIGTVTRLAPRGGSQCVYAARQHPAVTLASELPTRWARP